MKTSTEIWRGVVRHARASAALDSSLPGGLHESYAPQKVKYPHAVYVPVTAPYEDDWTGRMIIAAFDFFIFAVTKGEATDLDQLAADAFDGAEVSVDGQTTLICRRIADVLMPPDTDDEGNRIFQVGGTYELWTDQPLVTRHRSSFTLDAVIE